ncbi:chaperonin 10-like protein [Aspergillus californicus]
MTMKEAIVNPELAVNIIDSPIPKPREGEILIMVVVSSTNPKDWKVPVWLGLTINTGDDIASIVIAVGANVLGFHKGDRVAAFHVMQSPHGSFAKYAIAPQYSTFHIPDSISYEEASTIPLPAYTAALALFHEQELPSPWDNAAKKADNERTKRPLIIYGASSAAGIHPIIAVGGNNSKFVTSSLNSAKGDKMMDYTLYETVDRLAEAIVSAVRESGIEDGRVYNAIDTVGTVQTKELLSKVLAGSPKQGSKPRVTMVGGVDAEGYGDGIDVSQTGVGRIHFEDSERWKTFGLVWGHLFSRGLEQGWLSAHPFEVLKGGLNGLEGGLKALRDGTVRAKKVIVRIGDTEGVSS